VCCAWLSGFIHYRRKRETTEEAKNDEHVTAVEQLDATNAENGAADGEEASLGEGSC
jgi:hypothetical protein